ncbi:hypothetical protein [Streptomyces sp. YIM 98790]|uniref:hypothetical protein n=1 Tax=Streptomyces sp. YIM 98790 TaxID=2689077 RepID=UPI001407EBB0|nr:hypothetical protein [Streptomyces sp. YIM 98790]
MSGKPTAAALAHTAAEAVRSLNHATLRPDAEAEFELPGDAYAIVGALSELAIRLPQAMGQVQALIDHLDRAGRLRHDSGNPARLPGTLAALRGALAWSAENAELLHASLSDAHSALSPLGYAEGGEVP